MSNNMPDLSDEQIPNDPFQQLPYGSTKEDVKVGYRYAGTVNNIEDYGIFVTVANYGEPENEVTGLVHNSTLPSDPPEEGSRYAKGEDYYKDKLGQGDYVGVYVYAIRDEGLALELDCVIESDEATQHTVEDTPSQAARSPTANTDEVEVGARREPLWTSLSSFYSGIRNDLEVMLAIVDTPEAEQHVLSAIDELSEAKNVADADIHAPSMEGED